MSDTQPSSERRTAENITMPELTKEIADALAEKVKPEDLRDAKINERDIAKKVFNLIIRDTTKNPSIEITNSYVLDAVTRVLNSPEKKIRQP